MSRVPQVIVIVGPTASGKSDFAVQLARKLAGRGGKKGGAEIISADSRQVYKGLDIGTGKITKKEMKGVVHHLLDVANPKKQFTVVQYVKLAKNAIEEIIARGKTPIIVGGTGFYIHALVDGVILPEVPPNKALRARLSKKSSAELFAQLKKVDAKRAKMIDPHNSRRLIRAIEIATKLGKVPKIKSAPLPYDVKWIGLKVKPEVLRERIRARLMKRLSTAYHGGMIKEAKKLHAEGLSWRRMEELGLEYRYLALHLQGKISKSEMTEKLATEIWKYSRRQMTWFGRNKRIAWLTVS